MGLPGKPLAALVATEFAFASLAPIGKLVVAEIDPLIVAGTRVLVSSILLAIIFPAVRKERIERKDAAFLTLLAFLGVIINQILFLEGLERTTATNASILIATIPIFTLTLALTLGRERATFGRVGGVALGFIGVAILLRVENFAWGSRTLAGNLLILVNSFSYSVFLILARPMLAKYRSTTVVLWVFLIGSLVMVPLGATQLSGLNAGGVSSSAWVGLAWVVVVGTVLAYAMNNYALKRLSSSIVAAFVFLQPVVGVTLAVLVLGETLGAREVMAGLTTVAGVLLVGLTEPDALPSSDVSVPPSTRPSGRQ